ncbi:MAG: helix-turn-helix domain-containing protein [Halovenus sp.]
MREAVISLSIEELEALGLGDLVSLCREAGMAGFEEIACHANGAIVEVELERRLDGDRLSDLEAVEDWDLVAEKEGTVLYLIEFTAPNLPDSLGETGDDLVGSCDPVVGEDGTTMSFVGSQETLRAVLRSYEDAGLRPELHRLGEYEGGSTALDSLTDRQVEVLQTAYDSGFYDVPRECSADDVAAELDVDSSTVVEILQRAERNLLATHLSGGR